MKRRWYRYPQSILLSLLVATSGIVLPALGITAANPGLRVSGAILVAEVSPGETLTHKMVVGIGDSDQAADMIIQLGDIGQSLDGGYQIMATSGPLSPYSATSYITIDKDRFHLNPGTSQEVNLTIKIPGDVSDGGKYALINVRTTPTGTGNVGMVSAVNVPIYLSVKESNLIHTGEITQLTAGEAISGNPVTISTLFQNTGNHHFKVKAEVTISDNDGKKLDTINLAAIGSSILPGVVRELKANYVPQGDLIPGIYNIKSRVMLEDGKVLDEAERQFEVKTPYIPPAAPVSIVLMPTNAAILQTDDGRISIEFAKGSVISQAQISIRSYPTEQLKEPPKDYTLGATCFRVDGLTGLLAKEAVINVKYSSADLEKAGGDASRLVLARFDETAGQWTMLKTGLNTRSSILSASTNQFSIWAVMVEKPAAGFGWLAIAIIIGIAIIAIVIIFIKVVKPRNRPR